MRLILRVCVLLLVAATCICIPCSAETLMLEDGTFVTGKVISVTDKVITVKPESGKETSYDRSKIVYISFQDWVALSAQGVKGDTYFNYNKKCKVELPDRTWQVEFLNLKLGIEGGILEITQESKGFFTVLGVEDWTQNLDEYANALQSVWQKSLGSSYKLVSQQPARVGEAPAQIITFTGSSEGTPITYKVTITVGNNLAYRLVQWTMSSSFSEAEKKFDSIAAGFLLLPGSGKTNR